MANIDGLYVYRINPMDFGWEAMLTADQYRGLIEKEISQYDDKAAPEFEDFYTRSLDAAKKVGWEGDFRPGNEPHIASIPAENSSIPCLVWKQENDGMTFIAAKVPLAHLE
jgi:hypothetical protein